MNTTTTTTTPRFITLLLLAFVMACRQEQEPEVIQPQRQPETTTAEQAPLNASTAEVETLIPLERARFLQRVRIGRGLGASGAIEQESAEFVRGEPIVVEVVAKEVPEGLAASVVILDETGKELLRMRKEVPAASTPLLFEIRETASWNAGNYQAEIYLGGDKVEESTLRIVSDSARSR
ncbi:MAG TPA: hypothetical protein VMT00_11320 [Thermoanaerobaculia bacterium]|nr:hypothetical protein [Thermoanaerobaculia bacterium]